MRDPDHHLDENTVMDVLGEVVAARDVPAVTFHLDHCEDCRQVVDTCRELDDDAEDRVPSGD